MNQSLHFSFTWILLSFPKEIHNICWELCNFIIRAYKHTCIVLMVWRIIVCWSVTEKESNTIPNLGSKICKCFKGVKPKNINFEKQLLAWGANVTAKLWWKWSEYINNFWQHKGMKLMLVKMDFRSFLVSICDHEYKTQRDEKSN